jgi:hypothetical protein
MEKHDALELLELALKREIHPPPPIPPVKIATAISKLADRNLEGAREEPPLPTSDIKTGSGAPD